MIITYNKINIQLKSIVKPCEKCFDDEDSEDDVGLFILMRPWIEFFDDDDEKGFNLPADSLADNL